MPQRIARYSSDGEPRRLAALITHTHTHMIIATCLLIVAASILAVIIQRRKHAAYLTAFDKRLAQYDADAAALARLLKNTHTH